MGREPAPAPSGAGLLRRRPRGDRAADLLWGGLIVLLVALAYAPSLNGGYIWDDNRNVTQNANLDDFPGLLRIWTDPRAGQQYYPLTHTSFWIEQQVFGPGPFWRRLDNVLLHALAAVLLWRALLRLAVPGAWLAAAVFALHPVNAESVAWITERKNTLSAVFYFAALLVFLRFARVGARCAGGEPDDHPSGQTAGKGALAVVLFGLALLAKTATLTLPAALALIVWWKKPRLGRRGWAVIAVMLALGAALGGVTAWIEHTHVGARGPEWDLSIAERACVAGRALWFYAGKTLAPVKLNFIYPRWDVDARNPLWWLYPACAVLVVAALYAARRRIGVGPLVAVAFFALTLSPALGFVDFYFQLYAFVQDHFAYLAGAGLIALAAGLAVRAAERLGGPAPAARVRVASGLAAAALLLTLGALTGARAQVFRSSESLWTSTLARNPAAWMARINLGVVYLGQDRPAEAAEQFRLALGLDHGYHHEAHANLGIALTRLGRTDEAIREFARALELRADFTPAHEGLGDALLEAGRLEEARAQFEEALRRPGLRGREILGKLALALARMNRTDEALELHRRAAALGADPVDAEEDMANLLAGEGRWAEAAARHRSVLAARPGDAAVQHNLGVALLRLGDLDGAEMHLREALRLKPDNPGALNSLGMLFAARGRHEEAVESYRAALARTPEYALAHYNMGLSLEALGRRDDAASAYRAAISSNPRLAEAHNNLAIVLFFSGDVDGAWAEVRRYRELGGEPHPEFLKALAARTPAPAP